MPRGGRQKKITQRVIITDCPRRLFTMVASHLIAFPAPFARHAANLRAFPCLSLGPCHPGHFQLDEYLIVGESCQAFGSAMPMFCHRNSHSQATKRITFSNFLPPIGHRPPSANVSVFVASRDLENRVHQGEGVSSAVSIYDTHPPQSKKRNL